MLIVIKDEYRGCCKRFRRWIIFSDRNSLFNGFSHYWLLMKLDFGPLSQMCSSFNFCWHLSCLYLLCTGKFYPCFIFAVLAIIAFGQIENSKEVSLTRNLRGWILKRWKIFYKCDWAKIKTRQDVSIYPCMLIFFKPNCSRKLWLSNLGNLAFAFDLCNHKDQKVSNYNNHVWEIRI